MLHSLSHHGQAVTKHVCSFNTNDMANLSMLEIRVNIVCTPRQRDALLMEPLLKIMRDVDLL